VNGFEMEHLRDLIESTLSEAGMSDVPWYCTAEPSSLRQRPPTDRRSGGRTIRVVWKRREDILDFFDENGNLFQTVPVGDGRLSAAGSSA
jgi:hypothetical protein